MDFSCLQQGLKEYYKGFHLPNTGVWANPARYGRYAHIFTAPIYPAREGRLVQISRREWVSESGQGSGISDYIRNFTQNP
jgi:hypothetical protein